MLSMTHLDIREIDARLQMERHLNRQKAATDFKAQLALKDRCPKCTLVPPCKHFNSAAEFFNRSNGPLFKQSEWIMMNQMNRDLLIRAKKNS